ncbi:MAG TPA: hypothetical protein VN832_10725 [Stellaceae bacterium]|nr:hypothetical protein [Stellaceae bacterium]
MAARLDALLRRAGRDLFLPLSFRLAQRLEQVAPEEFAADPALAAFALRSAQKLFGADGTINWFDPALESASAGADGVPPEAILKRPPLSVALDLARRLADEAGNDDLVLGYLTGPATLSRRLAFKHASQIPLAMAKAYCEAKVSALLLAEEAPLGPETVVHCETLAPLLNLAAYYGIPVLLLPRHRPGPAFIKRIHELGVRIARSGAGAIVTLPIGERTPDECLAGWEKGSGRLVLSAWDIPPETAPEDVVAVARQVQG